MVDLRHHRCVHDVGFDIGVPVERRRPYEAVVHVGCEEELDPGRLREEERPAKNEQREKEEALSHAGDDR